MAMVDKIVRLRKKRPTDGIQKKKSQRKGKEQSNWQTRKEQPMETETIGKNEPRL
jgi:hypothetical protein